MFVCFVVCVFSHHKTNVQILSAAAVPVLFFKPQTNMHGAKIISGTAVPAVKHENNTSMGAKKKNARETTGGETNTAVAAAVLLSAIYCQGKDDCVRNCCLSSLIDSPAGAVYWMRFCLSSSAVVRHTTCCFTKTKIHWSIVGALDQSSSSSR